MSAILKTCHFCGFRQPLLPLRDGCTFFFSSAEHGGCICTRCIVVAADSLREALLSPLNRFRRGEWSRLADVREVMGDGKGD